MFGRLSTTTRQVGESGPPQRRERVGLCHLIEAGVPLTEVAAMLGHRVDTLIRTHFARYPLPIGLPLGTSGSRR